MTQNDNKQNRFLDKLKALTAPAVGLFGLIAVFIVAYNANFDDLNQDKNKRPVKIDENSDESSHINNQQSKTVWFYNSKSHCFYSVPANEAVAHLNTTQDMPQIGACLIGDKNCLGPNFLTKSDTCDYKAHKNDLVVAKETPVSSDVDEQEEQARALREGCIVDLDGFSRELQNVDPNDTKKIDLINKKINKKIEAICGKEYQR